MKQIQFNTEMVRAILDNRKTATRRVVKPQPREVYHGGTLFEDDGDLIALVESQNGRLEQTVSPYRPGDILYVRETWQEVYETEVDEDTPCGFVNIRKRILNFDEIPKVEAGISRNCATATMEPRMKYYVFKASDIEYADPKNGLYWHPSIHMPREAARLFLRVTDVRVERLQECGRGWCLDIEKEGIVTPQDPILYINDDAFHEALREEFQKVWDSSIKPKDRTLYGWEANPWVWIIEFDKISKKEALAHG